MNRHTLILVAIAALAGCDDPLTTDPLAPPDAAREMIDPGDPDSTGEEVALISSPRTRVSATSGGKASATGSMRFTASSGQQDVTVQVHSALDNRFVAERQVVGLKESAWYGLPFMDEYMSTTADQYLNSTCDIRVDGYTEHSAWYWFMGNMNGVTSWGHVKKPTGDSDTFKCEERRAGGGGTQLGENGSCEECQQWLVYDTTTGDFLYDYWECRPVSDDLCSTLA